MKTSSLIKAIVTIFIVSLIGDIVWHDVLLHDFYYSRLEAINGMPIPEGFTPYLAAFEFMSSAVMAYFLMLAAKKWTVSEGAFLGGLFGFAMVGAVNFVNHSLIMGWDLPVLVIDTAWGVLLGAVAGGAAVVIVGKKR